MSSDKDKSDKVKILASVKHVPKDAQVIMSILKELKVTEYEPRIINQILEFTYRYVSCILDDAKVFANHARKKIIDLDDVNLSTELVTDKAFTCPPERTLLAKLVEIRNAMPLPHIKPHCGLRLPPDRYCLTASNYKFRALNHGKKMTKSVLDPSRSLKLPKNASAGSTVKRPLATQSKTPINIPKPVIKFSTTPKSSSDKDDEEEDEKVETDVGVSSSDSVNVDSATESSSAKRVREDDEYF